MSELGRLQQPLPELALKDCAQLVADDVLRDQQRSMTQQRPADPQSFASHHVKSAHACIHSRNLVLDGHMHNP